MRLSSLLSPLSSPLSLLLSCPPALLIPFLLLGGGVLLGACGAAPPGDGTTPTPPDRECTAALRFEEPDAPVATDSAERPRTRVSLVLICENEPTRRVLVRDEVGACYGIDHEGALLRARCWWAGEGSMIEVVRDDDALVVRRAPIEESSGVGAFDEATRLEIPPGARVQAL